MQEVCDMEKEAARIAALSPEERAIYDAQLHAHRVSLGLERSAAIDDVLAERARQVIEEGWTPAHDDEHDNGELSQAAACYASGRTLFWPWSPAWWKPTTKRRNLVKAGALILAEIERLDRAASLPRAGGE